MRAAVPHILVLASLGLALPGASALATHASQRPAVHKAVPAARPRDKVAHQHAAAPARGSQRRAKTAKPVHLELHSRRGKDRSRPVASAVPESPRAVPAEETFHVTHDRKQHFAPGHPPPEAGSNTQPDAQLRKATSADFLTTFTAERKAHPAHIEANLPARIVPLPASRLPAPEKALERTTIVPIPHLRPIPAGVEAEMSSAPPTIVPVLYNKRGRLIMPPALKGSHEILLRQNEMADHDGLDRVQDDADLDQMRTAKLLVPIPATVGMQLDERLPANRRYCRPWTAQFLATLARAHYAKFHTVLQVNSAVRTVEFQQRLLLTNGNAAPAAGETASPHLTGQAIDLAKHGLSLTEIAWLRGYLLPLVQAGKVDVEEEFQQSCFHISVYRRYLAQPAAKRDIAQSHHVSGAPMAIALP